MSDIDENQLIAKLAHDVVAEIAPLELPLFQDTSEAYFKNPEKMRKGQSGKDEPLGFDGGAIASTLLLSPVVLAVTDEIIKAIVGRVAESGPTKKLLIKLHLAKKENKMIALPLSITPEQLREVRKNAVAQALQFRLSQKQAELLADSLVGKLTLLNQ